MKYQRHRFNRMADGSNKILWRFWLPLDNRQLRQLRNWRDTPSVILWPLGWQINVKRPLFGTSSRDCRSTMPSVSRAVALVFQATSLSIPFITVWCDVRTEETVQKVLDRLQNADPEAFKERTGLPLSPYFSAMKVMWLKDNVPAVRDAIEEKRCMFGTIDTWLVWVSAIFIWVPSNGCWCVCVCVINRIWPEPLMEACTSPMWQMLVVLWWWTSTRWNGIDRFWKLWKSMQIFCQKFTALRRCLVRFGMVASWMASKSLV